MFYITNIWALPFALIVWIIDTYLLLAALRLVLGRSSHGRAGELCSCLQSFTDPVPQAIGKWLKQRVGRDNPSWLPWLVILSGCLLIRYLVIATIMQLS